MLSKAWRPALRLCSCRSSTMAAVEETAVRWDTQEELRDAKPFEQMPSPKLYPVVGSLIETLRFKGTPFDLNQNRIQKLGPIFRDKMGSFQCVHLTDVNAIEKIHRLEGKYPQRIAMEPWKRWREDNKLAKGILIENEGPEWKRMRVLLDKQMLRPANVQSYAGDFNQVADDFIGYMRRVRNQDDKTIDKMDAQLFNWSLETIGTVLYETRFGNFADSNNPEMTTFIKAVNDLFESTEYVMYMPKEMLKIFNRKWLEIHENAWDVIFKTAKRIIDGKQAEILKKLEKGEEVSGFLSSLLASGKMSQGEMYSNISELMAAAVDTTSNTMQWVIDHVARDPEIQDRLHREVTSVVARGETVTTQHLQNMPFLKCIIKEVLRLYPVANVVTRISTEDMILNGYFVPKGTTILGQMALLARDPAMYEDPEAFKPDRWLRGEGKHTHSFAWLPFGFGPRMCIGRRVAELEMHILTAKLTQEFILEPNDDRPMEMGFRGIMVPKWPVNTKYIDRQ